MNFQSVQSQIRKITFSLPQKSAIEYDKKSYTYMQLYQSSNSIAHFLYKKVSENNNIAILLNKKPLLVEYILGVLKSGGVFVPLDPYYPENRLDEIISQIEVEWVLTEVQYLQKLNKIAEFGGKCLNVVVEDLSFVDFSSYPNLNIESVNREDSESMNRDIDIFNENCYIYFTSGSTGKQKGILGRHTSLKHFIDWEIDQFGISESDRVSQLITPTFDAFLRDIFVPLCSGATICMPEDHDVVLDPIKLIEWIDMNSITLIHTVPTLFKGMVSKLQSTTYLFQNLKNILLSGEALSGNDFKQFFRLFDTRIQAVNLYGATETTLVKSFYIISKDDIDRVSIPIGKPMRDTEFLILDDEMKQCPAGEIGQIYISTPFMSAGYYNDTELTNEVFITNPLSSNPTDIIYRTGDLGMVLSDGNFMCLGRMDNQVKIRGIRVELPEIETHILKSGFVNDTVVVAKEDESGNKFVCAFLVCDKSLDVSKLRDHLTCILPDHMVPSFYVKLDNIPLLPNGKVDRKVLLNLELEMYTGVEYLAPSSVEEEKLVQLWQEILHVKRIGVNENFFQLGGHSLKAANLAARIHKEFQVTIPVREIFNRCTISALAEYIQNSSKSEYISIPQAEEREYYPVSSAQKRIFLVGLIEDLGTSYNMPEAMMVEGKLDKDRLEFSFKQIINRHEALRTSFEITEEGPVQRIHKDVDFKIDYVDIEKSCDFENNKEKAINIIINDFIQPFNFSQAPLFRVKLIKLDDNNHIILRDMHHIIADGISEEILKSEFQAIYEGEELAPIKIQYRDYSQWQNTFRENVALKDQEDYWLKVLSGELPSLNMPADYVRPPKQSFDGDTITVALDTYFCEKIRKLSAECNATSYMVLLSVFNILLSKYTGQEDIILGSPVAGRNHADLDNVIGIFINTLAMRNYPTADKTYKEFLESVRDNSFKAFENQNYQFENLIDKLGIKRDLSRNPLFDVMFIFQNMHFPNMGIRDLKITPYNFNKYISKFDLTLAVIEKNGVYEMCFEYCTKLFRKDTIQRLAKHYINILKQVIQDSTIKLQNIDMLSDEEKDQLIYEFNNTYTEYGSNKTIYQAFQEQVEKTPYKTAVIFGDKKLTYREVNDRANQLARRLKDKGVGIDSIVGLMIPRSLEMIIGIMGILKAGGAYLPLDPGYPEERIQFMIEDSQCLFVLTEPSMDKFKIKSERINIMDESLYSGNVSNLENTSGAENLAYVIYTSGSTGNPKGVMLEHRNVINFIKGMTDVINFSPNKTILNLTTISFDIFVLETLLPLTNGLTIVVANEKQQMDPDMLCNLITNEQIDILQITPSRMQLLSKCRKGIGCLKEVKELIIGGEAFPEGLLQNLSCLETTRMYNVYGPTETTVWSTINELTRSKSVNIGKPIANTQIYILDKNDSLQSVGIYGELNIAGDGLARGYLKREDLTREKFVDNPFAKGLMYRTGDLARWLPNGEIEFLGRIDFQVKVRGHRIELTEIEKCMMDFKDIRDCVCIVCEDEFGIKFLVAYYLADKDIPVQEIRMYLLKFLPDYMVPQMYVWLEKIPLTPNGKVDRRALPQPDKKRPMLQNDFVAATSQTEKEIAKIWGLILDREAIGVNDSFFDLGGNSLLLVMMHNQIEKLYPSKTSVADIFAYPTILRLANYINSKNVVLNDISIAFLKFPRDFITNYGELNEDAVLEYKLDDAANKHLKNILLEQDIGLTDFFAGVYMYLLGETSGEGKVVIQEIFDRRGAPLEIDFSVITDIYGLFQAVMKARLERLNEVYPLELLELIKRIKADYEIFALFTSDKTITLQDVTRGDFLLKVVETHDYIKLVLEFSADRIKFDKAEEFINRYITLVNSIINKF